MRLRRARRGHVLLFAIGALALLTLFVVSLAAVLRLDGSASANLIEARRARCAAEAGIERAIHLLTEQELLEPLASFHAASVYRSNDALTWGIDLPLEEARHPSFPEGITPAGVPYSGMVSNSYGGGDLFVLKVVDCNSLIDLGSPQAELGTMLDSLGRAILEFDQRRATPGDPLHDPAWAAWAAREARVPLDPIAGRGSAVVGLRGALGGAFQSLSQLEPLLGRDALARLRPYVTLDAWRDPAHGWIAPVDVNTAPWPVLVACIEGVGYMGELGPVFTDALAARVMADAIDMRRRDPARGRLTGLADLAQTLGGGSGAVLMNARVELIGQGEGTGYPESGARDETWGDRSSLDRATVPFCYVTHGSFEVSSLGRVVDAHGLLLAQVELRAVVDVYDEARLVTQEDFETARVDEDAWETETFPLPVGALAGPKRFRMGGVVTLVYDVPDPVERRRLRWQIGHESAGYIQAAFAPPELNQELPAASFTHVFRLDADMQGEVWDCSTDPPALLAERHLPLPGLWTTLFNYGNQVGVDPDTLGVPGDPAGPPVAVPYQVAYGPDGVPASEGVDLRYAERNDGSFADILRGGDLVTLRFKVGSEGPLDPPQWMPLFHALIPADPLNYPDPAGWVRIEVEARVPLSGELFIRSRISSSVAPVTTLPAGGFPALNDPLSLVNEQHCVWDDPGGGWHTLSLVRWLNGIAVLVDGRSCEGAGDTDPWPAAWWGPEAMGTISPGGYTDLAGPPRGSAVVDDMVITNLVEPGGRDLLLQALAAETNPGSPMTMLAPATRFKKVGPDLLGAYVALLPRLASPEVQLGSVVVAEGAPESWAGHSFQSGDLITNVSYAIGQEPVRRQLLQRPIPGPDASRLADPYVRAWRLRRLRDRRAYLATLVERFDGWWRQAQAPPADAVRARSYERQLLVLATELGQVEGDIAAALAAGGEPVAPAELQPSAAFTRVPPVQGTDPAAVRLQIDFIYLDQLEPGSTPDATAAVMEVIIPWQHRPRVLRSEVALDE